MALVIAAHVEETATANGTASFALLGASDSYHRRVNAVAALNDTLDYTARDQNGNWENARGTYTSVNVLTRPANPDIGSNGTNPVTFSGPVIVSLCLGAATIAGLLAATAKVPVTTVSASGSSQSLAFPASGNAGYDITLSANCALTLTGGTPGQLQTIILVIRGGAGGFAAYLPSNIKWPTGGTPTVDGSAGSYNEFLLRTLDGGNTISGNY